MWEGAAAARAFASSSANTRWSVSPIASLSAFAAASASAAAWYSPYSCARLIDPASSAAASPSAAAGAATASISS